MGKDVRILTHPDCKYSKALKILLDYTSSQYIELDFSKNINLIKNDNKIPKVFVDGRLVGGYRDSLNQWQAVYQRLPEPPTNLYNPEYVISKYGNLIKR